MVVEVHSLPPYRQPPHNIEAEMAVLGAIFVNNKAFEKISGFLRPEHFSAAQHARIFEVSGKLIDSGSLADPITLKALFEQDETLEDIGGPAYLMKLADAAVTVVNVTEYGRIVHELYLKREFIAIGENAVNRAYGSDIDNGAANLIAEVSDQLTAFAEQLAPADTAPIDFAAWAERDIPERRWLVRDWIPWGYVTSLYGDGGTGKSLLAQMLATACATGNPWLGLKTAPCKVLGLFCEDDEEELVRRQDAINLLYDVGMEDLGGLWIRSLVDGGAGLLRLDRGGTPHRTPLWHQVTTEAKKFRAELVIVDTAADTFRGNLIDEQHARAYVKECLGRLAREIGGSVLFTAHPSLQGLSSGEGTSGSRQWNAAVRSRLYLTKASDKSNGDTDPAMRVLTRKKANYAGIDDEIKLRWQDGVFQVESAPAGIFATIERRNAETVFLECLDSLERSGRHVSDSRNAGNYAPKLMKAMPEANGFKVTNLEKAMNNLFSAGTIRMVPYGSSSNHTRCIVKVDKPHDDIQL